MRLFLIPLLMLSTSKAFEIPPCSENCFSNASGQEGCNVPIEYSCICSTTIISKDFYGCISDLCTEPDQQFARDIVERQCSAAVAETSVLVSPKLGYNITLSPSALPPITTKSSSLPSASNSTLLSSSSLASTHTASTTKGQHATLTTIVKLMTATVTAPPSAQIDGDSRAEASESVLSTDAKIAIASAVPAVTLIICFLTILYYMRRKKGDQGGPQCAQVASREEIESPQDAIEAEPESNHGYTFNLPEIDGSRIGEVPMKSCEV